MLTLLSPAKTLDSTPRPDVAGTTTPDFLDEAETLVGRLRKLTPAKLASLMEISDKLAAENHARFQTWNRDVTPENSTAAVFMFRGDVYDGLQADIFDVKDLAFAQKHLRILSGLYGVLRPLDLVRPYRLEMGTTFETGSLKTLYDFWGDKLADAINASVAGQKLPTVVNLASNEYFKAVSEDALCARVIAPSFKDEKDGVLRIITWFAKRARGLMAHYIVVNRIKNPDDLLDFDLDGYHLDESLSMENKPVFTRPQPG